MNQRLNYFTEKDLFELLEKNGVQTSELTLDEVIHKLEEILDVEIISEGYSKDIGKTFSFARK